MDKTFKIFKCLAFIVPLVFLLGILLPKSAGASDQAGQAVERVETRITSLEIARGGDPSQPVGWYEKFKINIGWDASSYGNQLKAGDYFYAQLPKEFMFPANQDATNFDLLDPEGLVLAKAQVTPDNQAGGGQVKVTFTDYVENRSNIKGDLWLSAELNRILLQPQTSYTVSAVVNGLASGTEITTGALPSSVNKHLLTKWGRLNEATNEVTWNVYINKNLGNYEEVNIEDALQAEDGNLEGVHYIADSFRLRPVRYNDKGVLEWTGKKTNISDQVEISEDGHSFHYQLGNIQGETLHLSYKTTYRPGMVLTNRLRFQSLTDIKSILGKIQYAESGGNGQGDLNSKIKIIKVDASDHSILLKGARFKLTNLQTGEAVDLVTDEQGEAVSDKLIPGRYRIEEVEAPAGYQLAAAREVTVEAGTATIETISDQPVAKTEILVTKEWLDEGDARGLRPGSIRLQLYADGQPVGQEVVVQAGTDQQWTYRFTDLPVYQDDQTTPITYTVQEAAVPDGYQVSYSEGADANHLIVRNSLIPDKAQKPSQQKDKPKKQGKSLPKTGEKKDWLSLLSLLLILAWSLALHQAKKVS